MKRCFPLLLPLFLLLLAAAVVFCVPKGVEAHYTLPPDPKGKVSASIDEQILVSDTIVLASLQSVAPDAEFVTGRRQHDYYRGFSDSFVYYDDDVYYEYYRPMQVLRFLVHEYLKGTGPSEIVVEVRHFDNVSFTALSEALAFAAQTVVERNATWDETPGALFLKSLSESKSYLLGHLKDSENFEFSLSNSEFQDDYLYTVDTLSRVWLPADPSQEHGEWQFMTDAKESPPPLLPLSDLRARIAEMEALVQAGEGVEGYEDCLYDKVLHERYLRAGDPPWTPYLRLKELSSGLPAGSELYRYQSRGDKEYQRYWVTGTSAALFENKVVDDDSDPTNGYSEVEATTRPLPEGLYHVNFHTQLSRHISCDFISTTNYYTAAVTVDSPNGTLHEAFFDPTASGVGDVSPAEFTVGGTSTVIQSLRWIRNDVVMTLSPNVPLSGYTFDFVALDGTVSLSLLIDEATADGNAGTLSWSMTTQPWEVGDQLMLRISSPPETASPARTPDAQTISAGRGHTCGVRANGETVCWGDDYSGQSSPPEDETFVSISAGWAHTCGLRSDGVAVCWGDDYLGQSSPPEDKTFVSISAGGRHTCGLRSDGGIVCWGGNDYGQSSPPAGEGFVAISAGWVHTCGLRSDGVAVCWGDDGDGQSSPPEDETFVSISAGGDHTCGLRSDGKARCWGSYDSGRPRPPGERFVAISAGQGHTCGLRADDVVVCWGGDREGQSSPPENERFVFLSAGGDHACGLRSDGDVVCWGADYYGQSSPPRDWRFVSITAGADHTCGLRADGVAVCWGVDRGGQLSPLENERFVAISAGGYHTCGLRSDGVAVCWGADDSGQSSPPEDARFVAIAQDGRHTCGLGSDGVAVCWGEDRGGQSSPPPDERFVAISAGWGHTCGLRTDGEAVCWGYAETIQSGPPPGERFVAIGAGWGYTCGLREDGEAVCWGGGSYGQSSPPPGEKFTTISVGTDHTCGLREDGEAACWGRDEDGQSSPPPGERFVAIGAGESHTCGLREDGVAVCWGRDVGGRTSPPSGERGAWP